VFYVICFCIAPSREYLEQIGLYYWRGVDLRFIFGGFLVTNMLGFLMLWTEARFCGGMLYFK